MSCHAVNCDECAEEKERHQERIAYARIHRMLSDAIRYDVTNASLIDRTNGIEILVDGVTYKIERITG